MLGHISGEANACQSESPVPLSIYCEAVPTTSVLLFIEDDIFGVVYAEWAALRLPVERLFDGPLVLLGGMFFFPRPLLMFRRVILVSLWYSCRTSGGHGSAQWGYCFLSPPLLLLPVLSRGYL